MHQERQALQQTRQPSQAPSSLPTQTSRQQLRRAQQRPWRRARSAHGKTQQPQRRRPHRHWQSFSGTLRLHGHPQTTRVPCPAARWPGQGRPPNGHPAGTASEPFRQLATRVNGVALETACPRKTQHRLKPLAARTVSAWKVTQTMPGSLVPMSRRQRHPCRLPEETQAGGAPPWPPASLELPSQLLRQRSYPSCPQAKPPRPTPQAEKQRSGSSSWVAARPP